MTMAYWNGMTWGVSPQEIAFLDKLVTGYSYQTSTNADKEGESPTEDVGMKDMEISFSTTYRVETGTSNIRGKIEQWGSQVGNVAPLIIGGSAFGAARMQLQDVSIQDTYIDASGTFRAATLSFKFVEYKESKSSGTSSKDDKTAVSVGASKSSKHSNKTASLKTNGTTATVTPRRVKDVDAKGTVTFR